MSNDIIIIKILYSREREPLTDTYRFLAKEGPWAYEHLKLGSDWEVERPGKNTLSQAEGL